MPVLQPNFVADRHLKIIAADTTFMNIRNVSNPVLPTDVRGPGEARNVKMDQSHQDRDSDGRRRDGEKEPDRSPLTEEELKKVYEYFDGLENFKANGLKVSLEPSESQVRLFVITDPAGHVVRRIPEYELRYLKQDKDRKTGQILDKAG